MTHYSFTVLGAGATPLAAQRTVCKEIFIQNNSTHAMNIGDSTVTLPTANPSRGIRLDPSGTNSAAIATLHLGPFEAYNIDLSQLYVFGTQNDHIDIIYTQ